MTYGDWAFFLGLFAALPLIVAAGATIDRLVTKGWRTSRGMRVMAPMVVGSGDGDGDVGEVGS
jgi:hypothetical protein